jgi:monothiol glutaredoxin
MMSIDIALHNRIERLVKDNPVMLFMKGTPEQPMCGFSARTVAALDSVLPDYASFNVLEDAEVREGIKAYGNWPTIPQLYINGELVGGCDIVLSMLNSGELHQQLGLAAPDRTPPEITLTDQAAEKIRQAMQGHEGMALHFSIDSGWDSQFNLGPIQGGEIVATANGLEIAMDIGTAQRARGAAIDWVKSMTGEGLSVSLPGAPPAVKDLSVTELAGRLATGNITLVDVRPAEDRAKASLEAALPLDDALMQHLNQLPRETELAFICHHGNSSRGAAEHFRKQGFTQVYNVKGGMDAWSLEVDSNIPRY